jgi:hypothetical protein
MRRLFVLAVALGVTACVDMIDTPQQYSLLSQDLTFFRFDSTAAANAEHSASFWAVAGQERSVALHYTDTGAEYLRFTVPAGALTSSDSVLISVDADAAGRMIFSFSPSGLKFSGDVPAQLVLNTSRANADIDGDGDVDLIDSTLRTSATIWKRESSLLPWIRLPFVTLSSSNVVNAEVKGFTDFGMAVN